MKFDVVRSLLIIVSIAMASCNPNNSDRAVEYTTDSFCIIINDEGRIAGLRHKNPVTEYYESSIHSAILSLKLKDNDTIITPDKAIFSDDKESITLSFENDIEAVIAVSPKGKYIAFELVSITKEDKIDAVVWGPYATSIGNSVGETVGIVQNDDFTIGLQALNPKTLGGYPWNDHDHLPQLDIAEQDDFNDFTNINRWSLFSVEAARPTSYGSSLQAYTRNRDEDRIIKNWGYDKYVAPAYDDGGLVGSKIALFGCKTDETLNLIGHIEEREGLPHPLLDGEWVKKSPLINSAYLIIEFGEDDIDRALQVVQKSGLKYLYHPDPFETWGHFELKKEFFPNGKEGLKMCVEKAERLGIKIGTHTLSNFINTSDPYVTPVPDKRLAIVGGSVVTGKIDEKQTEIEIKDPAFFDQEEKGHLQSLRINDEIIRYGSISKEEPWILKNCVRGAFGTKATSHNIGDEVSRLMDHGYKVFLTDMDLAEEVAENIADVFNYTGIRMLDFDGLEGNHSTGMGNYGEVLFAKAWYDRINDNIKDHFLLGASRPGHYFWHMYSRMNWGEPWYAGFRESQTEYRLKNQAYFKRNLMPGMLGWFLMTPTTSVEDIEWMLARSGGFNAGYAFVANYNALEGNGKSEEILKLLGEWEKARTGGAFTKEQEILMQETDTEFHLKGINKDSWKLIRMYSHKFSHAKKVRQPGEPLYSVFNFENLGKKQHVQFIITATDGELSNISMEMDNHKKTILNVVLKEGESIKYAGGDQAVIYDRNWSELQRIDIDKSVFFMESGNHTLTLDCSFNDSDEKPQTKIELRLEGESETINQK